MLEQDQRCPAITGVPIGIVDAIRYADLLVRKLRVASVH
jgi:hypothetical protein